MDCFRKQKTAIDYTIPIFLKMDIHQFEAKIYSSLPKNEMELDFGWLSLYATYFYILAQSWQQPSCKVGTTITSVLTDVEIDTQWRNSLREDTIHILLINPSPESGTVFGAMWWINAKCTQH